MITHSTVMFRREEYNRKGYSYERFVQAHDYKLKAEWSNTQNDSKFSGMTDAVYVSVKWEQVD